MTIGLPPVSEIADHIGYDPHSGIFTRLSGRLKMGRRADVPAPDGYRKVRFRERSYSAHRLAWFLMTGEWPDCLVDHRNLNGSDNRFVNLRKASGSQNSANRAPWGAVRSKGVTVHKGSGRFQAQIKKGKNNYYLGLFDTEHEAHAAYAAEAIEFYGEFARLSAPDNEEGSRS